MGLFGFGKKKEYKRGMADAAEVASQKFDEVDKAIGNVSDNLKTGIDNLQGDVNSIHDMLESDAREKLFDLVDELDIREDLNEDTKWFMISMLYSLGQMVQTSEAQKHYLRALTAYLKIEKSPQTIDVTKVINIDDREESRAIYTAVIEYLYLRSGELSFLSDNQYEDLFDSFNLNKRDKVAVVDRLNAKVATMGSDAIVLPYEAALVEKEENDKAETEKKESQSWPNREERIKLVTDVIKKAVETEDSYVLDKKWFVTIDINQIMDMIPNHVRESSDDSVMLMNNKDGYGVLITMYSIVLFDGSVKTVIPFDNVDYIYTANPDSDSLTLMMLDGTIQSYAYPNIRNVSSTLNVDNLYGMIHAVVKRGNFFLADAEKEIEVLFDNAEPGEYTVYSHRMIDAVVDKYIALEPSGYTVGEPVLAFANEDSWGDKNTLFVGENAVTKGGFIILMNQRQVISRTNNLSFIGLDDIKWDEIGEFSAEFEKGGWTTYDTYHMQVAVRSEMIDEVHSKEPLYTEDGEVDGMAIMRRAMQRGLMDGFSNDAGEYNYFDFAPDDFDADGLVEAFNGIKKFIVGHPEINDK
ncbi:hypothetical protein [Weissella cibaria]|uniref:hypothetical protein n=2 Tax=Weissella cibaria TaxID=137591 RepID=UPI00106ED175|nr:hypothetical protein [Weissella cibaria]